MSERKLIGLLAGIVCISLIAPKESRIILESISKPKKIDKHKESIIEYNSVEKLGLIRRTKKNIVITANKFWKWLY